jgi:hypothetical protein
MSQTRPGKSVLFIFSVLIIVSLACSTGSATDAAPTDVPEAQGTEGPPPIEHKDIPVSLPQTRLNHAGDYDASVTAPNKHVNGGDRFTFGQFERPFNADTMDIYFPYLDIQDTLVYQDDSWIFALITLKGPDASDLLAGNYGVELDTDRNGKGDWLIIAAAPAGTDWTTDGVQVFRDADQSVGAASAMFTDKTGAGNGFEDLVFDQGQGDDPDAAWVRISPEDANTVQIAIKRSAVGNAEAFLIGMWAGNASLDPSKFDLNDSFTHEAAGEADPGYEVYYPIKAVAELDNSCRMAVGFVPTGQEPGLCPSEKPQEAVGGCQATPLQISACNAQAEYSWNASSCSCEYTGPN